MFLNYSNSKKKGKKISKIIQKLKQLINKTHSHTKITRLFDERAQRKSVWKMTQKSMRLYK